MNVLRTSVSLPLFGRAIGATPLRGRHRSRRARGQGGSSGTVAHARHAEALAVAVRRKSLRARFVGGDEGDDDQVLVPAGAVDLAGVAVVLDRDARTRP